jgi:AmmeMemoRadiSam system protein A
MLQLSERDQDKLLRIARNAVSSRLSDTEPAGNEIAAGVLTEPHGAFVSIHKGSRLRGCIGNIRPIRPLYRTVAECAVCAATADPRFPVLSRAELPNITFEISILYALEPVHAIEDIVVGKHGIHIRKGEAHGILLPQVAGTLGWDRHRFLDEVCQKAGLRPDDLKESTIHRFSALVFGDRCKVAPGS